MRTPVIIDFCWVHLAMQLPGRDDPIGICTKWQADDEDELPCEMTAAVAMEVTG